MEHPQKKQRITVPHTLAALVLFASDRTCCVCHRRGKPTQIHHIDGDSAHNTFTNLSVLCQDCHWETQQQGGFTRSLDHLQVLLYRNDWLRYIAWQRWGAETIPWSTRMVLEHLTRNYRLSQAIRNGATSCRFDLAPSHLVEAYYLLFYPTLYEQSMRMHQAFRHTNDLLEASHLPADHQHIICTVAEQVDTMIDALRAGILGASFVPSQAEVSGT